MANDISVKWITQPFMDTMKEVDKVTDKATLYALRATGRSLVRAAKKRAPVYKGLDERARAESGNLRKSISNERKINHVGTGDYSMRVGPWGSKKKGTAVVRYANRPGTNLAQSLANARAGAGGERSTAGSRHRKARVGNSSDGAVRGVPLYRATLEAEYGFMGNGLAAASGEMRQIYEDAYAKAYERFR